MHLCEGLWRGPRGVRNHRSMKAGNTWTGVHTSSKTNSSTSTSSKGSSSAPSAHVTAARADASLLLRVKPLQNAWRYRKDTEKERNSRNLHTMNHGAKVNVVCYPIREIKHVRASFNCRAFCRVNSSWLPATWSQTQLHCAFKSSNSHWTRRRGSIQEVLLPHFFGIWLITLYEPRHTFTPQHQQPFPPPLGALKDSSNTLVWRRGCVRRVECHVF